MLAIEIFNITITSLVWLILLYPVIILIVILISIFRIIGFKGILKRIKDYGLIGAIKDSILFEISIGLFITLIIPVIIVACFPNQIIFTSYTLTKPHWLITPFMIIFFLVDVPLTLFIGLYIHNTHGMIFTMYSIPLGYLIAWLIDYPNIFEITPPYLFLAIILWMISWASAGQFKGQKRVGYACLSADEDNIETKIKDSLEIFASKLNQKGKKKNVEESVDFKGSNVAIFGDNFSGAYVHDYMVKYVPLVVMFRRLFSKKLGILKLPYAFSINTVTVQELKDSPVKVKYFLHKGSIYECIDRNHAKKLADKKNNTYKIDELYDQTNKVIAILPTCSDIVNAFYFAFGTIKIRLVTAVVKEKKRNFLFSYIWAPGSLVPSPLAYLALSHVSEDLVMKDPPIWLFNFNHDLGSKYMVRFNLQPNLTSIKPIDIEELCKLKGDQIPIETDSEIDTFKVIAEQYVESETSLIIVRKKISKAILLALTVIGAFLSLVSLFGLFM
ncbi:MAG: hypothetical protein ACTSO7_16980 [Candidatus Heimdallarchaeota archaeon]